MGALSGSTSLRSPEPLSGVSAHSGDDPARKLLATVLDYYEGRKPFDFHRLPGDRRANAAFDAWQVIAAEIHALLAKQEASK